MFLADMGAEVIKIEDAVNGDPVRRQGVMRNGYSLYFASFNRNKKSLSLDLRKAEGKAVLVKLIATADVILNNFRPGIMDRMGLGRAELARIKPDIVSCHVTGFGLDGPYRDRPSFDFIAQAMSGFMSVNGTEGEPPYAPLRRSPISSLAPMPRWACALHWFGASERVEVKRWRRALTDSMVEHALLSCVPLLRDGRAALAHRQRPWVGGAVRPVSGGRWPGGHRTVE